MHHLFVGILSALIPYLPNPVDKDGIGLRIHGNGLDRPLLAGEQLADVPIILTLLNFNDKPIWYYPFTVARACGELEVRILDSKGKSLPGGEFFSRPKDPFTQDLKLGPRKHTSMVFRLNEFSYRLVRSAGRYSVDAEYVVQQKLVRSPTLTFDVLDEKSETILSEHSVPLEGYRNIASEERARPVVQQIAVGKRTFLIYRRYNGPKYGGISLAYPTVVLAELSEKAVVKVEGSMASSSPLKLSYREPSATQETAIVIESIGGTKWTEVDEKHRQERLKKIKP